MQKLWLCLCMCDGHPGEGWGWGGVGQGGIILLKNYECVCVYMWGEPVSQRGGSRNFQNWVQHRHIQIWKCHWSQGYKMTQTEMPIKNS